jgi:hypothetical protein
MDFPPNYRLYLNNAAIKYHFPNLRKGGNFILTSLNTDQYNCISWALGITNRRTQLYDHLGNGIVDAAEYIKLFNRHGFILTKNRDFEKNKTKIAVYISGDTVNKEFKHVARLLSNSKWTSKLGDWEDIEHDTPEALIGKSYGEEIIIMERQL